MIPNETKSFAYAEANATRAYIYSQESTLIIQSTYFLTTQCGNKTHTVLTYNGGIVVSVPKSKALANGGKFPSHCKINTHTHCTCTHTAKAQRFV